MAACQCPVRDRVSGMGDITVKSGFAAGWADIYHCSDARERFIEAVINAAQLMTADGGQRRPMPKKVLYRLSARGECRRDAPLRYLDSLPEFLQKYRTTIWLSIPSSSNRQDEMTMTDTLTTDIVIVSPPLWLGSIWLTKQAVK